MIMAVALVTMTTAFGFVLVEAIRCKKACADLENRYDDLYSKYMVLVNSAINKASNQEED